MTEKNYTLGHITHIGGSPGKPGTPIRGLRFADPHPAEFMVRRLPDGNFGVTTPLTPWGNPIITGTSWEDAADRMAIGLPAYMEVKVAVLRALEPKVPTEPQVPSDEPPQPPAPPECGATIVTAPEA